jgi:peptidoglycan hydrolase-like protein with peptidoglycan-binding domain
MSEPLTRRVLPGGHAIIKKQLSDIRARIDSGDKLNLGDTGKGIKGLQGHLRAAGLYNGPISGTFDAATEAALKAFQSAKGLAPTGEVGRSTLKALRSVDVFVDKGFKQKAVEGQRGNDILQAEKKLAKLGFNPGTVDGIYDAQTAKAVAQYRKADRSVADTGKHIGADLFENLTKDAKAYDHKPYLRRDTTDLAGHRRADAVTSERARSPEHLKLGDRGAGIKNLEQTLEKAGFEIGRADGRFGSRTEAAVKAFQKSVGLARTGAVDGKTWKQLTKSWFAAKDGTSPAQRKGEVSRFVGKTERLLKDLGYRVGKVDGKFDTRLENAVKRFQGKHHLPVTGEVGRRTAAALKKAASGGAFAQKVLRIARKELGTHEVGWNGQKYSRYFGRGPEAWCADFVSWVYTHAGKKLNNPSTPSLLAQLHANGTYHRSNPKPGDIVMFDWHPGSGPTAEHTGIVESVFRRGGKTYIQTIEGNASDMVRRNQYAVKDPRIAGFGTVR